MMSPKEAAEFLEEPDWLALWEDLKAADDGFEVILTRWRRYYWTPVMINGVEKKNPAGAVEAMIALANLGIMPPRWAVSEHEGYQHNDHCFLMSGGREWRIIAIEDKTLILASDGETWQIDLTRAKWDKFIEANAAVLEAKAREWTSEPPGQPSS